MIGKKAFLLFSLLCCLYAHAAERYCLFAVPKKWDVLDPGVLTSSIKIGFVGKGEKGFNPSINVATEKVSVGLDQYVKAVKSIHEADRRNNWRDLGKFETKAGEGRLTEIEIKADGGAARLLQLLMVKDDTAYVMTAAASKEEFSDYYKDFQAAFRSFDLVSDLYALVDNPEKREKLTKTIEAFKADTSHAKELEKLVVDDLSDMGKCWQVQILKSIGEKK